MKKLIEVIPYDPTWPELFEKEASLIRQALGDNCLAIHHMGSTAVPGLAAKPVIDILPVVRRIDDVDSRTPMMEALGYEAKGESGMLFRRYFQKNPTLRTHNVHVYEEGNPEISRHLLFRDWMRTHPSDRDAYAALKKKLAQDFPKDMDAYCIGKEDFVAAIDAKTRWRGTRIVMALTPREWSAYHRIRKEQLFDPIHVVYDKNHPTITADNYFHFVLFSGTHIVSVAGVEFLDSNEAVLRSLATDTPFKQQGFGKNMLQSLERWLKQKGKKVLKMHAALRAEHFYRRLGYIEMTLDDIPLSKEVIDLGKVL